MLKYVVISSGEASGTSVEIIIKAVQSKPFGAFGGIIVTGDLGVYRKVSNDLSIPLPFSCFVETDDDLKDAEQHGEQYIFYNTSNIDLANFEYGKVSKDTGIASFEALKVANRIICNRLAFILVTTTVSSESLKLAGYKESGLTDLLSIFASSERLSNMLVAKKANIFLLSNSVSVKEAIEKITVENIIDNLVQKEGLFVSEYFDKSLPIAVGSLNPMRNDGTWSGVEESQIIEPAIDVARKIGIKAVGPISSDRLYKEAIEGKYSAILAMLRGEAYAALSVEDYVVITWGLPYMRVGSTTDISLDLAGKNIADITNLKKALEIAVQISDKGVFA